MFELSSHLEGVVKWEPVEENVGEELSQAEDAVHHPVGQPFGVVFFARTFNGFDSAGNQNDGKSQTTVLPGPVQDWTQTGLNWADRLGRLAGLGIFNWADSKVYLEEMLFQQLSESSIKTRTLVHDLFC